jgi:hypothetical protein
MSILAILEVALGLIFAWLVISLAVMYIQEFVVGKLGWRSDMLESYIGNLVTDPSVAKQLYDHPLIQGLHSGFAGEGKPAYIPSGQFAMALLDIIRNAPKEASLIQKTLFELQADIDKLSKNKKALAQKQLDITLTLTRKAIASEGGDEIVNSMLNDAKAQIRKLSTDYPELQPLIEEKFMNYACQKKQIDNVLACIQAENGGIPNETTLDQLRTGLAVLSVTQPELKQAVESLINGVEELSIKSETLLSTTRQNLEQWFDNGMERLSGWYKRRSQTLAFAIGISLAIFLNVDSLQLANQLWRDPIIRQSVVDQATMFTSQNPEGVSSVDAQQFTQLQIQIGQLNIPVGWVGSSLPVDSNGAIMVGDGTQKLCSFFPKSSVELFGLKIGRECYPVINSPTFNDPAGVLLKLIGLFISGVAAAQGAPFWFDILKKIINVRSSGANPNETAQKAAK